MLNLNETFAKRSLLVCLKSFPVRFKDIPTKRALEILLKLGHGREWVWWISYEDQEKRFEWTIQRLSEQEAVQDAFPLARHVTNLEFYGGPDLKLYPGTLLSLLMDRLLNAMDHVGFKALDAVIPLHESYTPTGTSW